MANKTEVLNELAAQGVVYNEVSEIFDEGDIASEQLYDEAGIQDFGAEMSAYLDGDSIEIVSIRNSDTVKFAKLSAAEAVDEIKEIMRRFYGDLG